MKAHNVRRSVYDRWAYRPTSTRDDHGATFSSECSTPIDMLLDDWYLGINIVPDAFDNVIRYIDQETEELRHLGLLKPFVEGEPIGRYVRTRKRKPTREEIADYHRRYREARRSEMLALREKNDQAIESLLKRIK